MLKSKIDDKGQLRVFVGGYWVIGVARMCKNCGKTFAARKGMIGKGQYKGSFCSSRCSATYTQRGARKIVKNCPICGTMFMVTPSRLDAYTTCRKPFCIAKFRKRNFHRSLREGKTVRTSDGSIRKVK